MPQVLSPGTRLGPYDVQALIGRGGMGEVYRAHDSRLKRDVALKVLSQSLASDLDGLARFEREAQVLASLNHPHIATVHGVEDSGGTRALVMELVEGETLADRIARGPLPLAEALTIASQIADALEAAHDKGIVHRDLKPSNIKLTSTRGVKVLDFGLAKIHESDAAVSESPTVTFGGTRAGTILGTAAYMSPEQARGMAIDKRTDLWAFGCVLYEMLCGRRAFRGETVSDIIAKILERDPDWKALPRSTPRSLRQLLQRCLRKDLESRIRDIAIARERLDDAQSRLDGRHRVGRFIAAAASLMLIFGAVWGGWQYSWESVPFTATPISTKRVGPYSIVIADFQNNTKDPTFDKVLELMVRRALEGSRFISAYERVRLWSTFGVVLPPRLDEVAARDIAVKHGLNVIVAGSISPQGSGYNVAVKALQAATGNVIATGTRRASNKNDVLAAATGLAATMRTALGDQISESDRIVMTASSATSLDAVRSYAAGMEAASNNRLEEARQNYVTAIEVDPKFGLAYTGLAASLRNLGKPDEADTYLNESLKHLDGMTERERLTTRASHYLVKGEYQRCAKEYGELVSRYGGEVVGRNQRALCMSYIGDMRGAADEMRVAVNLVPNRALFRINLALYENYAGNFEIAEKEARSLTLTRPEWSLRALAMAQLGQGRIADATETYQTLANLSPSGGSFSAAGLADISLLQGRFSDAVRALREGAANDLARNNRASAAAKLVAVAHNELLRSRKQTAIDAVEKALTMTNSGGTRFLAARSLVAAGEIVRARTEAARLSLGVFENAGQPEAYAKILEAEIALQNEDTRLAVRLLTEANALIDTWIAHFDLGLAYLKAGAFARADAEFDRCVERRGEALSLLLNEEPTYGYLAPVFYHQGRAREELKNQRFRESYRAYLDLRGKSTEDPVVKEIAGKN